MFLQHTGIFYLGGTIEEHKNIITRYLQIAEVTY